MLTNVKYLQELLKKSGLYTGNIDGDAGPQTYRALGVLLAGAGVADWDAWPVARRLVAAGQVYCRLDGVDPGKIDGFMGPQTRYAFEVYEARQKGAEAEKEATTWRDKPEAQAPKTTAVHTHKMETWPTQANAAKFFGAPGLNHTLLELPYPMVLAWDLGTAVNRITCNKKIAEPLKHVFERTLAHYGMEKIRALRLDRFGGCYNNRNMRGGSNKSMHAYACAIDFDPDHNQLKWNRAKAAFDNPEYKAFRDFMRDEGAVSLGEQLDYDWMHWQFARIR